MYGHRIGVEPHSLAAGTARRDIAEVSVRIHPSAPAASLDGAEHVVEADLGLPGGDLAICGPADVSVKSSMSASRQAAIAHGFPMPRDPQSEGQDQSETGDHSSTRSTCGLPPVPRH